MQIAIPSSLLLLLLGTSEFVRANSYEENLAVYQRELEELYDSKVELGARLFDYGSERAFNGDGFSFSAYELPETIRTRFESADASLLSDFPKKPSYRKHWSSEHWRRSPFDKHLDFALSSYDSDQASGLNDRLSALS